MTGRGGIRLLALAVLMLGTPGCGKFIVNRIGNGLTSGPSVYETDDDIPLIGDALPFSLKFIETLLAQSPEHPGLLLAACKGYTLYAYVYIQQAAEMEFDDNVAKQRDASARAKRLLLRALGYGLRGLESCHTGFGAALGKDPAAAAAALKKRDVPLAYWTAAALGLAIGSDKGDAEMIARLPEVDALLSRVLALDDAYDAGAPHEFMLSFASSRPGPAPDPAVLKRHFDRALALSGGNRASLFVAWAEAVSVKGQDRADFKAKLALALSADAAGREEALKLANAVARRRAAWLLGRADVLFLSDESDPPQGGTP